ncbi:MAG: hypothetical protein PHU85_17140, partial [Phycisphaerae bacterium]|nr:hypothetical protein [Phycisphaerae bacterium]
VGRWVLPSAVTFIALVIVWAICAIVGQFMPPGAAADILRGVAVVVGVLSVAAGAATLAGVASLLLAIHQLQIRSADREQLEEVLHKQSQVLERIGDELMLSDRARAVAFREKERDALRHAIQEELGKRDWEAAYHLIDEMQRSFGYRAEAERLRIEVDQRKREASLASLSSDMGMFRELLNNLNWSAARVEAQKLAARYPDQPETLNLLAEVDDAREAYKRRLLSEFKQAIDRSEFDRGVNLLRELDQYLTPGEAAGLQEAARGVFRGKLHNLGVQFSIAISGKNWAEALRVGEEIIAEFPNSRMAVEVQQNRDALRKRAAIGGGTTN